MENEIVIALDNGIAEVNIGVSGTVFGIVITVLDQPELPRAFSARTTTLYVFPLVRPLTSYCTYCPTMVGKPIFTIDDPDAVFPYREYWYPVMVLPPLKTGGVINKRTYLLYADANKEGVFGTVNGIVVLVVDHSETPLELIARIPIVYVLPLTKDEIVVLFIEPDCDVIVIFAIVCVLPFT